MGRFPKGETHVQGVCAACGFFAYIKKDYFRQGNSFLFTVEEKNRVCVGDAVRSEKGELRNNKLFGIQIHILSNKI